MYHENPKFQHLITKLKNKNSEFSTFLLHHHRHRCRRLYLMEKRNQTVVLFPFMAQGHFIPYLSLALSLEQKGFSITLVTTPLNITHLHKSLPPTSSIKLAEIPFNSSDHGLSPEMENTDSIPYNLIPKFVHATAFLASPFKKLLTDLAGKKPLCVVSDFMFGWAIDAAHQLGLPHAIFCPTAAFGMACYSSIWRNFPHKKSDSGEFVLPDFPEAGKFDFSQLSHSMVAGEEHDSRTIFVRKYLSDWSNTDAFLLNTVEEIDGNGLKYFRSKLGIPVWPIGPLFLPQDVRRNASTCSEQCIEWLNRKEPSSVVYISFGSQFTISPSQMMNLAKALYASGRSFIWVVRPPVGFDINSEFLAEKYLPDGFYRKVQDEDRGLIVRSWAPQMDILAHKSVAAFMSHCGWNSVLESLKSGVPLLGWPIAAEQFYNARLLVEEIGVCVEVARGIHSEVTEEDIVEKIELVMAENGKGKEIRRKAGEIKDVIRDAVRDEDGFKGSSVKNMEEFLDAVAGSNSCK